MKSKLYRQKLLAMSAVLSLTALLSACDINSIDKDADSVSNEKNYRYVVVYNNDQAYVVRYKDEASIERDGLYSKEFKYDSDRMTLAPVDNYIIFTGPHAKENAIEAASKLSPNYEESDSMILDLGK